MNIDDVLHFFPAPWSHHQQRHGNQIVADEVRDANETLLIEDAPEQVAKAIVELPHLVKMVRAYRLFVDDIAEDFEKRSFTPPDLQWMEERLKELDMMEARKEFADLPKIPQQGVAAIDTWRPIRIEVWTNDEDSRLFCYIFRRDGEWVAEPSAGNSKFTLWDAGVSNIPVARFMLDDAGTPERALAALDALARTSHATKTPIFKYRAWTPPQIRQDESEA